MTIDDESFRRDAADTDAGRGLRAAEAIHRTVAGDRRALIHRYGARG